MVLECMHPNRPGSLLGEKWLTVRGALSSKDTRTAAALCIRFFAISQVIPSGGHDTLAAVFALMEDAAGSRTCGSESLYRSAAAP
eukprot:CAMPEP_0202473492 /NCGR_PEP_ID=MMETSP1360-20130828/91147_1 /ASSEMBLY_ACC=CAM_ASM_000848 /TAXON_ID=515479 /ORGANISM="Licmophora paradoxa, Strain CCMP2313" /LENGTH=84 /DNA_ID=CAMNT_0049100421 /DNA_START=20 /DNA_END=271 /DNA_ORIENTATION=-